MRSLPRREVSARSTQFTFVVFSLIGLTLSAVFSLTLPASLSAFALIFVALLGLWAVYIYFTHLRVKSYRFGSWFVAIGFSLIIGCVPFLLNALVWLSVSEMAAAAMVLAHVSIWTLGYLCGTLRLNHEKRLSELAQFVRVGPGTYFLANRPPTWAEYSKVFKPRVLERLFQIGVWSLTAISLVFAALGAGGATALLAVIGLVETHVPARSIGMVFLAVPSLLGLGYLSASVFAAGCDWNKITRGGGREVWPVPPS